ncbi:MAG: dihydrolipoyl dehydrogenase [Elusimicrobiota bacterium]
MDKVKVLVVGGGPGGYAAAFLAADLGLETVLVDCEANPGGVCLYRGCIPSKALLHAARIITEAKDAAAIGLAFSAPAVDVDKLRSWKDGIVRRLTGGLGMLAKQRKIRLIQGRAKFIDPHTVEIDGHGKLGFEHAIVATGSRPAPLPGIQLESERLWDSSDALALKNIPQSLLVIGGGYIGLEMGTLYAALGTRVTTVEMLPALLPGADKDLVDILSRRVRKNFEAVFLASKVAAIEEAPDGLKVLFEGRPEQLFENVLVAVGRKPNSAGLGLENTKVGIDERGFIVADDQARTAEPSIFAIGDVAGEPMLAHKASHEGRAAVRVIAGEDVRFAPKAIPGVVFTDPEAAWCGLTEAQAAKDERRIEVLRFPWAASGRALTLNRTDGMTKLIVEPGSGTVLGAGIVGAGAGDLIAEAALAVEAGITAKELAHVIHAHPTTSETLMEAAEILSGTCTHIYRPKHAQR